MPQGAGMKKILIAIDGSEGSLKAVEYVGRQFSGVPDVRVTLFHVLSGLPPEFWDEGHIFSEKERASRKEVEEQWLAQQQKKFEPILQTAREMLSGHGIAPEQIDARFAFETIAIVPDCIVAEAKDGGYQTLVIGRCGQHHARHLILGSNTSTIVQYGSGLAVCVVG
jgi:nucleotide-binding universal stress UspA family protein